MDSQNLCLLLDLLSGGGSSLEDIQRIVKADPLLTQLKRHTDGRLALHSICTSSLPDRQAKKDGTYTEKLLKDIDTLLRKIDLVANQFLPACELSLTGVWIFLSIFWCEIS